MKTLLYRSIPTPKSLSADLSALIRERYGIPVRLTNDDVTRAWIEGLHDLACHARVFKSEFRDEIMRLLTDLKAYGELEINDK